MFKNAILWLLMIASGLGAFATYQSNQKSIALTVLLDDKSNAIAVLESDNDALAGKRQYFKQKWMSMPL